MDTGISSLNLRDLLLYSILLVYNLIKSFAIYLVCNIAGSLLSGINGFVGWRKQNRGIGKFHGFA